jgi:cytochrome c-type biogenesis protein CcmH/NrfG
MKKETWLFVGVTLVVGILAGVLITNRVKSPTPSGPSSAPPSAALPAVNSQQQISMLEGIVAKDPDNRNAWVQLGHNYFDSHQPMKAVEAYGKALALDGNDPDVLTDQGVMFRELGWYDRAVENFTKANRIQPTHAQSLYNLGVVYLYDLKDPVKASAAWEKYLAIDPSGPGADKIRAELEFLKSHQESPTPMPQGIK